MLTHFGPRNCSRHINKSFATRAIIPETATSLIRTCKLLDLPDGSHTALPSKKMGPLVLPGLWSGHLVPMHMDMLALNVSRDPAAPEDVQLHYSAFNLTLLTWPPTPP